MLQADRPNEDDKKRFGKALSRAMDKSPLKVKDIASQSGLSHKSLSAYRLGQKFPLPQSAAKLAEVLNAPGLTKLAVIELECPVCKKTYYSGSQKRRGVCSDSCYQTYYARNKQRKRRNALSRANRELMRYREAVKSHCLDCTAGEYLCQMADCELRPVSPLPLRKGNHVTQPERPEGPTRRVHPRPDVGIILTRRK